MSELCSNSDSFYMQINISLFGSCPDHHSGATCLGDNDIPTRRQPQSPYLVKGPKQRSTAWPCLCRPYARQPTGNARNARLQLDRIPCSPDWLLVGRATETMFTMSSHTIGTRHLWLFGHGKNESGSHSGHTGAVTPPTPLEWGCSAWYPDVFEQRRWVYRDGERVSPQCPTSLSHLGWFKWPVITFPSHCLCSYRPLPLIISLNTD